MSIQIQFRRGTTAEHSTFTGAVGEITVDTTKDTAVVHDNSQVGGFALLREDGSNSALSDGSASAPSIKFSSSTTTGIYSPGTNQFAIATNGVGRITIDASGNIVAGGTLTVGSFIPTSSTIPSNGLYSPGTNQLALSTNGTGRLFIDSSGNVGVGATAPVFGAGSGLEVLRSGVATVRVSSNTQAVELRSDAGTGTLETRGSFPLKFGTAGSERLRIDSSGRLLLGVTSAVAGTQDYKGLFASSASSTHETFGLQYPGIATWGFSALSNADLRINRDGNEYLRIDSSGNVGVGVTANLAGSGDLSLIGNKAVRWAHATNGTQYADIYGDTSSNLVFRNGSSSTERMRIDSSGRLGVGTSSPSAPLHVKYADATTTGLVNGLKLQQGNATNGNRLSLVFSTLDNFTVAGVNGVIETHSGTEANNVGRLEFYTKASGGSVTERMRIDSSGRVGIGTTSPNTSCKLSVSNGGAEGIELRPGTATAGEGDILFYNRSTTSYLQANYIANIHTWTGPSNERARIDSSGRLLVGTSSTTAGQLLTVQGSIGDATGIAKIARADSSPAATGGLGILDFSDSGHTTSVRIKAQRDGGTWTSGSSQPSALTFSTTADGASSPTERMRITSTGDIGISAGLTLGAISPTAAGFYSTTAILGTGAGTNAVKFNTTTGKITYDTSSRLNKEQIEDCPYGITEIKQLQPRRYYRIDDERLEVGFVADEVVGILPEFVPFGPKSAITGNEQDTEEIPLGVNYEKLTAVLTAALQEAIGEIESLKARVAALESA